MNFKKRVNGSWVDTPHYIAGTDTETITALPATIYPRAQTATIGLKGNTTQNGTPTPDNPVPVVGVGDLDNGNYKIPISSASTTTTVYLGEVQSTRQIKKKVFDGSENWSINSVNTDTMFCYLTVALGISSVTPLVCSHFVGTGITTNNTVVGINVLQNQLRVRPENAATTTLAAFKQWLSDQYTVGTPVCVWYVLATETTGIVNEQLMKIGDYADSISGISITTTAGANTLDVQTTLKPSEVTASFNGWHPVSSAHERSGGSWT